MTDVNEQIDAVAVTDWQKAERPAEAPATDVAEKKNQTMSLTEAGAYDMKIGARNKKTGWGIISADRAARGISRQARIRKKNQ